MPIKRGEMARGSRRTLAPASTQAPLASAATRTHPPPPAGIMQLAGAMLAALLCTAALCSPVFSAPYGADTPTACCFSYISRQIQRKFVDDYFETSSQCSKPGVIFQTKRGRQVCAHPSEAWVQEYMTDLELNA
ncbi:C-C motif chemokine 3-like [Dasypus novemcinctus]|uniref:C-C motif chemokine 3-like n=1 Tax=Dasypus novemcinctus TaxID=9361 RepID=UPI000328F2A5|nr:C-C motif chemokine 3-like [Dasypus novemcinctus]